MIETLRGRLIVSVQADAASVLNTPAAIALIARAAVASGAAGVRVEGLARIAATVRAVDVPVIGIVKRAYAGFEPYITATQREIAEVCAAGAAIVALDATGRRRPDATTLADAIAAIHARDRLAMADCSTERDVAQAIAAGADIVATTLCGYTQETAGAPLPAFALAAAAKATGRFTILEGGIATGDQVIAAFAAGADAVVVGTAITNIDARVRAFDPRRLGVV